MTHEAKNFMLWITCLIVITLGGTTWVLTQRLNEVKKEGQALQTQLQKANQKAAELQEEMKTINSRYASDLQKYMERQGVIVYPRVPDITSL